MDGRGRGLKTIASVVNFKVALAATVAATLYRLLGKQGSARGDPSAVKRLL